MVPLGSSSPRAVTSSIDRPMTVDLTTALKGSNTNSMTLSPKPAISVEWMIPIGRILRHRAT
jgi:hypothetical protein